MRKFQEKFSSIDQNDNIKYSYFLEECDGFFVLSGFIVLESCNCLFMRIFDCDQSFILFLIDYGEEIK